MTPEQQAALAARLAEPDIASPGGGERLTEEEAAALLNTQAATGNTVARDVPTADIHGYLLASFEWGAIELVAEGVHPEQIAELSAAQRFQIQALCRSIVSLLKRDVVEMTVPARAASVEIALDGLVTTGLLSTESRAALLAMAQRAEQQSWADANSWGRAVTSRDVGLARGAT